MKRSTLVLGGVVVIAIAVLIAIFAGGGGKSPPKQAEQGPTRAAVDPHAGSGTASASDGPERTPGDDSFTPPDPQGTILLEGQVLGDNDTPVGGAVVWVSSVPPRSVKTDDDGSFSFDKLLPREYTLDAHAGDAVGGPVMVRLGPNQDPVVIRLRDGATLAVHVTSDADGKPIAGATVTLADLGTPDGQTDASGVARFRGLGAGWTVIKVKAAGFAEASTATSVGAGGSSQDITLTLRKGAPLSGKVVDEQGAPVPRAMVALHDAGAAFEMSGTTAMSGDDGGFTFPVVAAGSYTLTARDADHAPGASDILSVDGVNEKKDVVITVKAPATVRGRVVTKEHQPAPFAAVEVAVKQDSRQSMEGDYYGGGPDRVTADAQGAFELRGLPRAAVRIHAENEEAGSSIVDLDLSQKTTVDNVELVLDVDGEIDGVVVDAEGQPVAEAQVSAFPDVFSGGAPKMDDLQFAGFTAATTDGGGAFRLHGLPDGGYRLWASRTAATQMMFQTEGTLAKTGDRTVRIVLPAPGGISGHLVFASGEPPKRAIVEVGVMSPTPVVDGEIALHDIPPGTYDVTFRGPEFTEMTRSGVEVKAGATTDLGTITVQRGRQIAGKVVDAAGNPVAGARVIAGQMLFSQGKGGGIDPAIEDQLGVKTATSGDDGTFVIFGAPAKGGSVMADDDTRGRSDAVPFDAGTADVTSLTLALRGFGSVAGQVTMAGKPVAEVQVMDTAKGSSGHVTVVATDGTGHFVIDKLPEGDHRITANRMENFEMTSAGIDVHVDAGKRSDVTIDIPVGSVTLAVEVKGKAGAKIDAAQVFLFRGNVQAKNAKDITDRFLAGDAAGMKIWFGGNVPEFASLVAGSYSVCTLPINGNLADGQFQQRLQKHLDVLLVYCSPVNVTAAPDRQTFTSVVPPMNPLPPDN